MLGNFRVILLEISKAMDISTTRLDSEGNGDKLWHVGFSQHVLCYTITTVFEIPTIIDHPPEDGDNISLRNVFFNHLPVYVVPESRILHP
jgi:hypothetical protein